MQSHGTNRTPSFAALAVAGVVLGATGSAAATNSSSSSATTSSSGGVTTSQLSSTLSVDGRELEATTMCTADGIGSMPTSATSTVAGVNDYSVAHTCGPLDDLTAAQDGLEIDCNTSLNPHPDYGVEPCGAFCFGADSCSVGYVFGAGPSLVCRYITVDEQGNSDTLVVELSCATQGGG